jgi:type II restriction/modification system DNA methylase subunit YeeA
MPKYNKTVFAAVERLIQQILDRKKADNSADTADLENQIDQLVYQLYELTEEEIKIIENA